MTRPARRATTLLVLSATLLGCGARSSLALPTLESEKEARCRPSCDRKRAGDDDGCGGVCEALVFGGTPGSGAGFGNGEPLADTWTFDGDAWDKLDARGPSPRFSFAMAALGKNVVVFGGGGANPPALGDTWTLADEVWSESATSGPPPRVDAAMAELDGALILEGGSDGLDDSPSYADCWRWDGSTWTQLDDGPQRAGAAIARLGHELVLFGGSDAHHTATSETWIFRGDSWSKLDVVGPPARTEAALAAIDGEHLVLFGGFDLSGTFGDTWSFDGATWTELADAVGGGFGVPVSEAGVAPAMTGLFGEAVRFGGCSTFFADQSTVSSETTVFRDGAWIQLDAKGPEGRCFSAMVTR